MYMKLVDGKLHLADTHLFALTDECVIFYFVVRNLLRKGTMTPNLRHPACGRCEIAEVCLKLTFNLSGTLL